MTNKIPVSIEYITSVASKARSDFETKSIPLDLLIKLYDGYCANINTTLFVREALNIFPRGNCGLASIYLKHQLATGEATYGQYVDKGHTIWHMGRAIMADITSDQFGGPPVYVGPIIDPWSLKFPSY